MQKEGLHSLAYSLTLDPAEEIRGALEDITGKNWQELSLDKLVEESAEGLEAELKDAQVQVTDHEASYRTETAALPENYANEYGAEDAEVSYRFNPDVAWEEAKEVYEDEVEKRAHANIIQANFLPVYPTAEMSERVKNYGISIGSLSFVLYDIKQRNF